MVVGSRPYREENTHVKKTLLFFSARLYLVLTGLSLSTSPSLMLHSSPGTYTPPTAGNWPWSGLRRLQMTERRCSLLTRQIGPVDPLPSLIDVFPS